MKIKELLEKDSKKGTYAGAYFSQDTVTAIRDFCKTHSIPSPVPNDKIHCTILFSRKYCPDYQACGKYPTPLEGSFSEWAVWDTSPSDPKEEKTKCLILQFNCPDLEKRHKELMDEHGATYDYDQYKPHLTLSYNIGDFSTKSLPAFKGPINIEREYQEDLNLDWAKANA